MCASMITEHQLDQNITQVGIVPVDCRRVHRAVRPDRETAEAYPFGIQGRGDRGAPPLASWSAAACRACSCPVISYASLSINLAPNLPRVWRSLPIGIRSEERDGLQWQAAAKAAAFTLTCSVQWCLLSRKP